METKEQFCLRKEDHLKLALDKNNEAEGENGLSAIRLEHRALPELNFSSIETKSSFWDYPSKYPFFISSMTAGHEKGERINQVLAQVAAERKWPMGLGSQRRELSEPGIASEWKRLRKEASGVVLFGNLGISQLIETKTSDIQRLVDSMEASAICIHCNALQEVIQEEGTPQFEGALSAIEKLSKLISVPVVVKETGCGFGEEDLKALLRTGVGAIDVSGYGGTHWGRIEGKRGGVMRSRASHTFCQWGIPTAEVLENVVALSRSLEESAEIWASGGIRTGLDAAKCIALGADKVGFARPALLAAMQGEEALSLWMESVEYELRVAMFCTGSKNLSSLKGESGGKYRKII